MSLNWDSLYRSMLMATNIKKMHLVFVETHLNEFITDFETIDRELSRRIIEQLLLVSGDGSLSTNDMDSLFATEIRDRVEPFPAQSSFKRHFFTSLCAAPPSNTFLPFLFETVCSFYKREGNHAKTVRCLSNIFVRLCEIEKNEENLLSLFNTLSTLNPFTSLKSRFYSQFVSGFVRDRFVPVILKMQPEIVWMRLSEIDLSSEDVAVALVSACVNQKRAKELVMALSMSNLNSSVEKNENFVVPFVNIIESLLTTENIQEIYREKGNQTIRKLLFHYSNGKLTPESFVSNYQLEETEDANDLIGQLMAGDSSRIKCLFETGPETFPFYLYENESVRRQISQLILQSRNISWLHFSPLEMFLLDELMETFPLPLLLQFDLRTARHGLISITRLINQIHSEMLETDTSVYLREFAFLGGDRRELQPLTPKHQILCAYELGGHTDHIDFSVINQVVEVAKREGLDLTPVTKDIETTLMREPTVDLLQAYAKCGQISFPLVLLATPLDIEQKRSIFETFCQTPTLCIEDIFILLEGTAKRLLSKREEPLAALFCELIVFSTAILSTNHRFSVLITPLIPSILLLSTEALLFDQVLLLVHEYAKKTAFVSSAFPISHILFYINGNEHPLTEKRIELILQAMHSLIPAGLTSTHIAQYSKTLCTLITRGISLYETSPTLSAFLLRRIHSLLCSINTRRNSQTFTRHAIHILSSTLIHGDWTRTDPVLYKTLLPLLQIGSVLAESCERPVDGYKSGRTTGLMVVESLMKNDYDRMLLGEIIADRGTKRFKERV